MISISKDQIDTLIQLQEIELEVDTIEKKLNKIPARLDDLDAKLTDFTKGIEEKERMLAELEKTYRTFGAGQKARQANRHHRTGSVGALYPPAGK